MHRRRVVTLAGLVAGLAACGPRAPVCGDGVCFINEDIGCFDAVLKLVDVSVDVPLGDPGTCGDPPPSMNESAGPPPTMPREE